MMVQVNGIEFMSEDKNEMAGKLSATVTHGTHSSRVLISILTKGRLQKVHSIASRRIKKILFAKN